MSIKNYTTTVSANQTITLTEAQLVEMLNEREKWADLFADGDMPSYIPMDKWLTDYLKGLGK